jgi:hypothetical protein
MTRHSYFVPWAKTVASGVGATPKPGKPYMGYHVGFKDHVEMSKKNPGLRKRWSEKAAVTKRAQSQKVSLAPVPSLDGGERKDDHGASAAEAGFQARL